MQPLQDLLTPPPPTATLPPAGTPAADVTATPVPTLPPTPLPDGATPIPTVPITDGATSPGAQQSANLAAVAALLVYLTFFGVMGYRRGTQRELIVFIVALSLSFLLQRFSGAIVTVADRFGKGLAFVTGQSIPQQSGLGAWAEANTTTLLILLWLAVVGLTYILTGKLVRKSKKDGWAVILGVLNGLIFATIFAPLLTTLIFPEVSIDGPMVQYPVLGFISNVWEQVRTLVVRTWDLIQPVASNVFFLGVILLILLAAMTLRTSVKPKS